MPLTTSSCFFFPIHGCATMDFIDSDLPITASENGSQSSKTFPCRDVALHQVGLNFISKLASFISFTVGPANPPIKCSGRTNECLLHP